MRDVEQSHREKAIQNLVESAMATGLDAKELLLAAAELARERSFLEGNRATKLSWGKYKGRLLGDVLDDVEYVHWLLNNERRLTHPEAKLILRAVSR